MKLTPRYDAPPIISIEGRPDDQHAPVVRQRKRMETLLRDLGDDEWKSPTRCEDWTVQDVVAHVVGVNAFWRTSVQAALGGTPTRLLTGFDPAATPPLMVEPMRALTPAEVLDQFVASNDAFLATLDDLDATAWSKPAETPAGHVSIRLLAQHALWDGWVHERDIAIPLGMTPAEEPDEVLSCLLYAAALSPAFSLTSGSTLAGVLSLETREPEASFHLEVDESVTVRVGSAPGETPCLRGAAAELVEALSLRAPLPPDTPPEWRRLLAGLATAFDSGVQTRQGPIAAG